MRYILPVTLLSTLLLLTNSCDDDGPELAERYEVSLPAHFPPLPVPEDNPLTVDRVALGKQLFFDPILSKDATVSCASCHDPAFSFTDLLKNSRGVEGAVGDRNSMPIVNLAYANSFFWDGSNPSLEEQAIHPIINPLEMASDLADVIRKLENHPTYPQDFQQAFGGPPTTDRLVKALAAFERTLVSANSAYDRYVAGDENALTDSERRGMNLFFNHQRGECFHCHTEPFFTDFSFQNNGLYSEYQDEGRRRVTGRDNDEGKFKVPSLRNIEYTGPYMHDGSMSTLEEVVDHYAKGGNKHRNQSILLDNIEFSEQEKQNLIAFLKALSDPAFIQNPDFRPK
ncbi:MAG: cytochrome c peroxidase [Bacteroidota bacterium]